MSTLPSMAPVDAQLTKPTFIKAFEPQQDFHWTPTDEPHATRRKLIMAKYPQVKKLFGHCWKTKYIVAATVLLQTYLALTAQHMSWPMYLCVLYVISGTANHAMMMGMHEVAHNLGFKKPLHNKLLGVVANLPLIVPSSTSFKRYHLDHHRYQGVDGVDVDVPTVLEGKHINTKLTKSLFVCFQLFFYALRPLFVKYKTPGFWEYVNLATCFSYGSIIYAYGGLSGLLYLLLGTVVGSGIHPVAGHFIAEHYEFVLGYETYSYYGILNRVTFNVGFHNEHHDFPFIAGSRLHELHALAPEFYENLPRHTSWVKVMYDYIMNDNINAFSRVKRHDPMKDVEGKLKKSE
uniref:sphingolipid 4-desaturase n=1 Tax=Hyaloperonospora arabidopsidis (strain Emoy2) TaxID=559515 RepID=M4BF06_HYAAE